MDLVVKKVSGTEVIALGEVIVWRIDETDADDPAEGVSGRPSFGRRVEAGWAISLQFTTGQRRTSRTTLTVPEAVGGRQTVDLL